MDQALREQIVITYKHRRNLRNTAETFGLPRSEVTAVLLEEGVAQNRRPPGEPRPEPEPKAPTLPPAPPLQSLGASPEAKPNPLLFAAKLLEGFCPATMTYRGRRRNLDDIMRLANEQAILWGIPQIDVNPAWRV